MPTAHVIGAGMAGLACALKLLDAGMTVRLYEAGPRAGGRCRSYFDDKLGCVIDNGNHLVLNGNSAVMTLLGRTGADKSEIVVAEPEFPFVDLDSGERWAIRLTEGRFPWWVFQPGRRAPGTGIADYLSILRVILAGPAATVSSLVPKSHPLFRSFWEPFTLAVLNTAPAEAAACLLKPVFLETFARGAAYCRPVLTRRGLAAALVDPTLRLLSEKGCEPAFGRRLRSIGQEGGSVTTLDFGAEQQTLGASDAAVLAVSPEVAKSLLPDLEGPSSYNPILNIHFRLPEERAHAGEPGFLGILGGLCQWVFFRGEIASVTVSAALQESGRADEEIAAVAWAEVAQALGQPSEPLPAYRIIKEKRATFAQTPEQIALRPSCRSRLANLWLAGDWTDTGLPATIEGAVRSGETAARAILDGQGLENVAV